MKLSKKLLSLALCATCATSTLSGLTACGGRQANQLVEKGKTQLYVKYYKGGLGAEWIDTIIADFETKYANYSFEEGKTGVQIMKEFEKSNIQADLVESSPNQVFILESMNYYEFYSKGVMLDLTELVKGQAVTGPNATESGKTIESKMSDARKDFYNMGTDSDPKYYALPFYESSLNFIYNVDLFEKKGWYFAEGKTAEGMTEEQQKDYGMVQPLFLEPYSTEAKSYGPDNVKGTQDDGLPATYADFQALLTLINSSGAIPFIGNGYSTDYLSSLATELWATASGLDEISLNLSLEGTSNTILDLDNNGNVQYNEDGSVKYLENYEIKPSNAYMLHQQKGKLDAIKLVKMLVEGGYYFDSFSPSFSHRMAQSYFINGYEKDLIDKEVAMLVDGSWWNSEARSDYASNEEKMTKRFAFMPIPKPDASQLGENTVRVSERSSLMFIKKNCEKNVLPAALAFMSYLQSDEAMNTFSLHTDMLRAMDYEITSENLSKMTYFGKSNYEMTRAATTDWIDWVPTSETAMKNESALDTNKWGFSNGTSSNPFIYYTTNKTAPITYFNSIISYYKDSLNLK